MLFLLATNLHEFPLIIFLDTGFTDYTEKFYHELTRIDTKNLFNRGYLLPKAQVPKAQGYKLTRINTDSLINLAMK